MENLEGISMKSSIRAYKADRAILFSCLFILVAVFLSSISYASPPNLPKQQKWVTDQPNILDVTVVHRLVKNAKTHEKNTTDQLVTLIVRSLDGWAIEHYGRWVGNNWGIGQKGKDNGVLLLVAIEDRKVRIEVGRGLEKVVTNSIAKSIIDHKIVPHFKRGDMQQGVIAGHKAIIEALGGEYRKPFPWENVLTFLLMPFLLVGRAMGYGGGSFTGGGGSFGGGGASGSW